MKNAIIIGIIVLIVAAGIYYLFIRPSSVEVVNEDDTPITPVVVTEEDEEPVVTEPEITERGATTVIGSSVNERDITAYHFGEGDTELLFVGGIHGGYEWNTVLLSYELIDYLEETPEAIPDGVMVTVIPVLNPDGLFEVVGSAGRFAASSVPGTEAATIPGRFNANDVDLNRNFDCEWQESGTWQSRTVSGGDEPFSEPESEALRAYVETYEPDAAVVYYSAAGGVFASNCRNGVSEETLALTNLYADASGYKAYESFDFYEITGDMVNWLAKENIPAISVLLTTHQAIEWNKNKLGVDALLEYLSE